MRNRQHSAAFADHTAFHATTSRLSFGSQHLAEAWRCARWFKYHRITSVHREYGDYIAFACLWSPYVNPYALPAARTRASCGYERLRPVVKALH